MLNFYDVIIAFLCCAGIVVTFYALFQPHYKEGTRAAGVIVSEDVSDIIGFIRSVKPIFNEIIVVTRANLDGVIPENIKVVSPEEFEEYVTGANQN